MKHLFTIVLFFGVASVFGQVTENFDKATLSTGSLACWSSDYNEHEDTERRAAHIQGTPLSTDSHLSLNTSTPIGGTASLNIQASYISPASGSGGRSIETLYSTALGTDGNTVSFDLRINTWYNHRQLVFSM